MKELPASVRPVLGRLARRLAIGLFLEVWPPWAAASLLLVGVTALVCRIFVPSAASALPWLWLAPLVTAVPALVVCFMRAYRPGEIVAVADWLGGGQGVLLTLLENNDPAWAESPLLEHASSLVAPTAASLAASGRVGSGGGVSRTRVVASAASLAFRREHDSCRRYRRGSDRHDDGAEETGVDHSRRGEEPGRGDRTHTPRRTGARRRVFVGGGRRTSRARRCQALREAGRGEVGPGEPGPVRGRGAGRSSSPGRLLKPAPPSSRRRSNSWRKAVSSPAPQQTCKSCSRAAGCLPTPDRCETSGVAGDYLGEQNGRFGQLARLGKEFGRFDPSEFPLESDNQDQTAMENRDEAVSTAAARMRRSRGARNRCRSTASRHSRCHLAPHAVPDDWAPLVVLPGAPQESPELSSPSAARTYAAAAGQTAWRRTLAPRHQSAVKKYFEK